MERDESGNVVKYDNIADVPTELLARNFIGTLIMAKGNVNKWHAMTLMLIRGLRGEKGDDDGDGLAKQSDRVPD